MVDYYRNLRILLGNRPMLLVGATLLVLTNENRLLLMKRSDNDCWGPPGGSMELGESFEDTLKRETREETGLKITDFTLFGAYAGEDQHYTYPNGDEVYIATVVYITRINEQPITLDPSEHVDYDFFALDHLPEKISPPIIPILKDLARKIS